MLEELMKLGLSEKEAKVYLTILELTEDTVQNISRKSGVKRATVYVALERLLALGLVSQVERGKKTLIRVENPIELHNIVEEQQVQIDAQRKYAEEVTNRLLAMYNAKEEKPVVRYFEGKDGLVALERYGRNALKPNTEGLSIAPIDLVEKYFASERKSSLKRRVDEKIKSRTIYTHEKGMITQDVNEQEMREAVFLPRDILPIYETIRIYPGWGVKVFNFDANNFFGVAIQSDDFAKNMQAFFELAWVGAKALQKDK